MRAHSVSTLIDFKSREIKLGGLVIKFSTCETMFLDSIDIGSLSTEISSELSPVS